MRHAGTVSWVSTRTTTDEAAAAPYRVTPHNNKQLSAGARSGAGGSAGEAGGAGNGRRVGC
jgi:hypothetical protein